MLKPTTKVNSMNRRDLLKMLIIFKGEKAFYSNINEVSKLELQNCPWLSISKTI